MNESNKTIQELEESIADKIKNYHSHLNEGPYDVAHVDRWICQFPEEERWSVLAETNRLLETNYIDQKKTEAFFDYIWNHKELMGENPYVTLNKTQILNIQQKGHSQKRMLERLEKYYWNTKTALINKAPEEYVENYIYLDDCMYTGFTMLHDIDNWIDNTEPKKGSTLWLIFIGGYEGNRKYILSKVQEKCTERNITVKFDCMYSYNTYNLIWPWHTSQWSEDPYGDPYVEAFVKNMEEQKKQLGWKGICFRTGREPEQDTKIFQRAILKKGAYLCSLPTNPNKNMKPMGYALNISLGFGAFFATDYNISNNCPLAFWWGNASYSADTTLGKWYPLLPREANETK